MYNELYEVWRQELQNAELTVLPSNFNAGIADYIKRLRDEGRMLDKKTLKASLLRKEMMNARRMFQELMLARYKKLIKKMAEGERASPDVLTAEEKRLLLGVSDFHDAFKGLVKNTLHGYGSRIDEKQKHSRTVLRFLKDVPPIIGSDMRTYGPFRIEDVASLPVENAKMFVRQGLAEEIEVK